VSKDSSVERLSQDRPPNLPELVALGQYNEVIGTTSRPQYAFARRHGSRAHEAGEVTQGFERTLCLSFLVSVMPSTTKTNPRSIKASCTSPSTNKSCRRPVAARTSAPNYSPAVARTLRLFVEGSSL